MSNRNKNFGSSRTRLLAHASHIEQALRNGPVRRLCIACKKVEVKQPGKCAECAKGEG